MNETELPVKAMQDINWSQLTRAQGAALGLQMSLYSDAWHTHGNAKTATWTRCNVLLSTMIVTLWTTYVNAPGRLVAAGVIALQTLGLFLSWLHMRARRRALVSARTDMEQETLSVNEGMLPKEA